MPVEKIFEAPEFHQEGDKQFKAKPTYTVADQLEGFQKGQVQAKDLVDKEEVPPAGMPGTFWRSLGVKTRS